MPKTDKKLEDQFRYLARKWLSVKKSVDAARERGDHYALDVEIRKLKKTARQMREMLNNDIVLR